MGIYDREYYQEDDQGRRIVRANSQMSLVTKLVIINFAIFIADAFTRQVPGTGQGWLSHFLSLGTDVYMHPLKLWTLLSYGFAHASLGSPEGIWHVGMNMFMLWMFGRDVEMRLGKREFLTLYLVAIVVSGLVWLGLETFWLFNSELGALLRQAGQPMTLVGASGAVMTVFILFVLYDPRRTLYIWGIVAVPAWMVGLLLVGSDYLRAITNPNDSVAWQAHLAGAGLAFLYFRFRWNFSRFIPNKLPAASVRMGPRLKVHDPDQRDASLEDEADRVLAKVHQQGLGSLTARERKVLEAHSRRVRDRRGS